jgi:hypothetical protein
LEIYRANEYTQSPHIPREALSDAIELPPAMSSRVPGEIPYCRGTADLIERTI